MIITLPLTCLVSWRLVPRPHPAYCHLQCEQVLLVLQVKISWVGPGNKISETQPELDLAKGDYYLFASGMHALLHSQHRGGYLWNNYPTEALPANSAYIYLTN